MVFVMLPLALAGLAITVGMVTMSVNYYRESAELARTEPLRNMMLAELDDGLPDAPVEPKTGDVYFPESRVYLPRRTEGNEPVRLKYTWTRNQDNTVQLNVSERGVLHRVATDVRNARNSEAVFAAVPHLQVCVRGVYVTEKPMKLYEGLELKHVVRLADGRALNLYLEKGCPELATTAALLTNLRSY